MSRWLQLAAAAGAAAVVYRVYKRRQAGRFVCMSYNILIES